MSGRIEEKENDWWTSGFIYPDTISVDSIHGKNKFQNKVQAFDRVLYSGYGIVLHREVCASQGKLLLQHGLRYFFDAFNRSFVAG